MLSRLFPLSRSERLRFLRQLYVVLQASLPLPELLRRLARIEEHPLLCACLNTTVAELERGATLSMVWSRFPRVFPDTLIHYLRLGEESGRLGDALQEYLEFASRADHHRLVVWSTGCVMLAIVAGLSFILYCSGAQFITLLEMTNPYSPFTAQINVTIWLAPENILLLLAVLWLPARLLWFRFSFPLSLARLRFSRLLLCLPALGSALCKNDLARFLRAVRLGLVSGLPMLTAGRCAAETVENRFLAEELGMVVRGLQTGKPLSKAFSEVTIPVSCLRLALEAAEQGGELDIVLAGQADIYTHEAETVFRWATGILEPLVGLTSLALMGGFGMVLLRILAVFSGA